jgi:glucose dehydrogenase
MTRHKPITGWTVLRRLAALAVCATLPALAGHQAAGQSQDVDWPVYRGDPGGTQFSPLAQIHAANVHTLKPAWTYRTGDATERSTMHANPIVVDGVMYLTTPSLKVVALDAATGRERWTFDPARHHERRGRTDLRLRQGSRVCDRRANGRADLVVRTKRLHRPA